MNRCGRKSLVQLRGPSCDGAAPGRPLSVRVVVPPTSLLMPSPHRRHPLSLTVVCIVHPEVRDSDLVSPHKTNRDQRARWQRTRNRFVRKPELCLALIQLFCLGKGMERGLEVSRVCKYVFQVLASRRTAVSNCNLLHHRHGMHVRWDSSGKSLVNAV